MAPRLAAIGSVREAWRVSCWTGADGRENGDRPLFRGTSSLFEPLNWEGAKGSVGGVSTSEKISPPGSTSRQGGVSYFNADRARLAEGRRLESLCLPGGVEKERGLFVEAKAKRRRAGRRKDAMMKGGMGSARPLPCPFICGGWGRSLSTFSPPTLP